MVEYFIGFNKKILEWNLFSDQKSTGSILANSINLKGSITCKGDLQIDGRVNGNINGEKVILGPESNMEGTLNANEVIISGNFKGKLKGKSIRLDSGASIDAEIQYEVLAIEDGSVVNGTVKKLPPAPSNKKSNIMEDSKKDIKQGLSSKNWENSDIIGIYDFYPYQKLADICNI